jgi:ferredoxin-NADP reductase
MTQFLPSHVEIFDGEYNCYIWPCVAIWRFDRTLRIVRVVLLNNTTGSTKAVATYNSNANVIRLTLPISGLVEPRPGAHYYIYVFNGLRFWESHPFTLSSWKRAGQAEAETSNPTSLNIVHSVQDIKEPQAPDSPAVSALGYSSLSSGSAGQTTLSFIIRPYDGFTSQLRRSIASHESPSNLRVLIEGPYGHTHNFTAYESILFIVGGAGVTAALSYLCDLSKKDSKQQSHSIELVWSVHQYHLFNDVFAHELSSWLERFHGRLRLSIFITGQTAAPNPAGGIEDTMTKKSEDPMAAGQGTITTHFGRPVIGDLVLNRAREASGYKMAILACGPAQMADDTRAGVVRALAEGCHWVDYFPESFGWQNIPSEDKSIWKLGTVVFASSFSGKTGREM